MLDHGIMVDALVALERRQDERGRGDESTDAYVAVASGDAVGWLELFSIDGHPVLAMDQLLEEGYGLGGEPSVLGVAFVSEAWRHLDDEELRAALPPDVLAGMMEIDDPEVWAGSAQVFRDRIRPRDLPDHLRREVRIAALLTRDGAFVQVVRDLGAREVSSSVTSLADMPKDAHMPWAMHRLLTTSGDVRIVNTGTDTQQLRAVVVRWDWSNGGC